MQYAYMMVFFATILTFSTIAPLILPFGMLYYLCKHFLDSYLLVHVRPREFDSDGGMLWYCLSLRFHQQPLFSILSPILQQDCVACDVIHCCALPVADVNFSFAPRHYRCVYIHSSGVVGSAQLTECECRSNDIHDDSTCASPGAFLCGLLVARRHLPLR